MLVENGYDIQELQKQEWMDLKVFTQHQRQKTTSEMCALIFLDEGLQERFKNMSHLLETVQVLPMSTAICEREFSTLNRGNNDWHSRLSTEVLNQLLFICPEGSEYETAGAMERWWSGGERVRRVPKIWGRVHKAS